MKRKPRRFSRTNNLSFYFSMIIFLVMLAAMAFTGSLLYGLAKWGWFTPQGIPDFWILLILLALLSTLAGTILGLCFSDVPLRPLRRTIEAMEQLAKGNFDTRLDFQYPQELKELSDSFNLMAKELGGTEILRSDFVNNFSHEFKTPIISIKGFAELLKDPRLPAEQREEYIDIILEESARLSELSTNVLNLTKLENTEIITDRHLFDLGEQVRKAALLLQQKWEKKELQMDFDLQDVMIYANEEMLLQVWINLLDNAIKFTPERGTIHVMLINNYDFVTIIVKDTGIGMHEEQLKHIFAKFYQGDQAHHGSGNGLGLCVVKKIVELHGGSILAESVLHQGSTFTVSLPKKEERPRA